VAISIRRITPDDWQLLRDIRLASLADSPHAFGARYDEASSYADQEWRDTARASASGDSRAWFIADDDSMAAGDDSVAADDDSVAADDEKAVGLVQARRRQPADCLLFSMWVAPEARRLGAGRLLVDAVDAWGAAWGAQKIVLWVIAGNEPAQRFYERLGFRVVTDGPDAASGGAHDAFAMERPLRGP
jgi:ribosomal protein S18 acetylase RimI-like enzyme